MKNKIVLMQPHMADKAIEVATETLGTRWIGQGPKVDAFEKLWQERYGGENTAVAVNSGTSALHMAYMLADIKEDDYVITPVFSCSATHIPLVYQRANILFADIQEDTFNIDPRSVETLLKKYGTKVKAIVVVHYAGIPCDMAELKTLSDHYGVPIIEDAAQAHGAYYDGEPIGSHSDFVAFSFQAVKTITTIDGGMVMVKDPKLVEKARRLRWFGIDRKAKFEDRWKQDIFEVGYKYQMSDVSAAIGMENMKDIEKLIEHNHTIQGIYERELEKVPDLKVIKAHADFPAYWLATILVKNRDMLRNKLADHGIESNPVHYRCDRYQVLSKHAGENPTPNMDRLESEYLVIPSHMGVTNADAVEICEIIQGGWQ